LKQALLATIAAVMMAAPAWAHHSFAMYDQTVNKTLSGKLTRYVPGANHAQLLFVVVDNDGNVMMKDGKPYQFGVETGSAIAMARNGVTVKTMAEGSFITVRFYPLRDGRDFGALAGMLVLVLEQQGTEGTGLGPGPADDLVVVELGNRVVEGGQLRVLVDLALPAIGDRRGQPAAVEERHRAVDPGGDLLGPREQRFAGRLEVGRRDPLALCEIYKNLRLSDVDVLVLSSCVQMPSLAAVPVVEQECGLPVISASIATTYQMLKRLGLNRVVPGAGELLSGRH